MAWLRIAIWFEITMATNHIPKAFVFSWTHVILVVVVKVDCLVMAWLRIAIWFEITMATNHIPKAFMFSWTHVILVVVVTSLHLISNPSSGNHRQLLRSC